MPPKKKPARRAYGEGSVSQRPNGLWVGRVELPPDRDGKRKQVTVTSMDHAVMLEKLERAKAEKILYGHTGDPAATVTQWTEKWLTEIATKRVRGKTYASYASALRKWVQPNIGRKRIARLTPDDWRRIRAEMDADGRSSTHALQVYHVLRKCLEDAKREGIVTFNVLDQVDKPGIAANTRGAFTVDQVKMILRNASSRHVAALLTGCRQSELLGLTWPCVELDGPSPMIRVEWQLQELGKRHGCGKRGSDGRYPCGFKQAARCPDGQWQMPDRYEYHVITGRLALVRPKTKHGYRAVPVLPPLAAALRLHLEHTPPGPHGLVWHNDGEPIHHKDDEAEWKQLMASVGLPAGCTLHWARHSAATLLMESRVDTKVVGQIVGHGSTAVTQGYQHVTNEQTRRAMEQMWELLA